MCFSMFAYTNSPIIKDKSIPSAEKGHQMLTIQGHRITPPPLQRLLEFLSSIS